MMDVMVNQRTCVDEGGNAHTFTYFLLQDDMEYGVGVHSDRGEAVRIPHITPDRTRITQLLDLLCRLEVSPIHLRDVIDDWL